MKKFVLFCILFLLCSQNSSAQVTSNVLRRTFLMRAGTLSGTAFTIEVDGRQYLITAKHCLNQLPDQAESKIQILRKNGWLPLKVKVLKCDDPCDIAVMVPEQQLTINFALEPSIGGLFIGQDVYFVGYPFGDCPMIVENMPDVFGMVKKATFAQIHILPKTNMSLILLDGLNNPGFSGSPVVFQNQSPNSFKVAGVVSGFRPHWSEVKEKVKEITESEITSADRLGNNLYIDSQNKIFRLRDTDKLVALNTGIIRVWDIRTAVDLIRKNPIGPKADDQFTGEE